MKNIKKWQIVILIILGVGGYWLSQNMWVFEKKVHHQKIEKEIIGTWKNNDTVISFHSENNRFTENGFREINLIEKRKLNWKLDKWYIDIIGFWEPGSVKIPCTKYSIDKKECSVDETPSNTYKKSIKIIHFSKKYLVLEKDKNALNLLKYEVYQKINNEK